MENIKKTLEEVDNKLADALIVPQKDAINFAMPVLQKLYAEVNPNITTCSTNNILYFNSTEEIEDNAFFMQVLNTYQMKSSTFASLINLRRNMIVGNGLEPVVSPTNPKYQPTIDFLNNPNTFGETLQEQWNKLAFDYSLFECYGLEVIYNGLGNIVETIHIDASTIRAKANQNPSIPITDTFYISRQWAYISNKNFKRYTVANSGIAIPAYNPKQWAIDGGRQLLYVKRYNSGNNFYAIPSFMSILSYCELEYLLSQYHLGTVSKGFFPQVIVSLAGNPNEEEKQKFTTAFKNKYSGADKEKIMFIWTTNADDQPKIIPFQQAATDNNIFEILNNLTIQRICSGMGASLELAGISAGNTSLGGDANKLAVAYNLHYTNIIRNLQKTMLEGINKIMKINGLSEVTVVTPPLKLDTTVEQTAPTATQTSESAPVNNINLMPK
jgi:hypothetical protein